MKVIHTPLQDNIHQLIEKYEGRCPFSAFMDMCLYDKQHGYYMNNRSPFGADGDFITAPAISPLFAQCLARIFAPILMHFATPCLLELGPGTGNLAATLLPALIKLGVKNLNYLLLEVSPALRAKQQQTMTTHCPELLDHVSWLDALPTDQSLTGVIFANEMLDALPVDLFCISADGCLERFVSLKNGELCWRDDPARPQVSSQILTLKDRYQLPTGYVSEIHPHLPLWLRRLDQALKQGIICLIDYGYSEQEYYHADRTNGTLMCYRRHQRQANPLLLPGQQDITAHVNFTALAESAHELALHVAGFTTQAGLLLSVGLLDLLHAADYQQTQAIKTLTMPSAMGEIVKALCVTKAWQDPVLGFQWQDRRRDL